MQENPAENQKDQENDFEANQNLLGFFQLLFKVDMRNNPHLYIKPDEKETNNPSLNAKLQP